MSFFSRSRRADPQPLLGVTSDDLARLGRKTYGGDSPHPPGFAAAMQELDTYALKAMSASGFPESGQPGATAMMDRVFAELGGTAEASGGWAWVGGLAIAQNLVTNESPKHPGYLEIVDRALLILRDDGVAYPAIPQQMLRRWEAVHGTEGVGPAQWPSALETTLIEPRELPLPDELGRGEALRVAVLDASPQSNAIFVEQRPDGSFQVSTEAVDSEDGIRKRWEWIGLSAPTYGEMLRELGDRLVTPKYWAHDDLAGFFPCRSRSRDELRIDASALRQPGRTTTSQLHD